MLCALPGLAAAQDVPGSPIAQSARDLVEQSTPRERPEAQPLRAFDIELPTRSAPAGSEGFRFTLQQVRFEGASILPPESLAALHAGMVGKEITLEQAFGIVERAQSLHRDAGYIFTRVIAPPQTIEDGVFRIAIVAARIGKVVVTAPEGAIGPVEDLVRRIGGRIAGKENPTLAELERVLLLINDIPGIDQATAVPRAGTEQGEVDLYINVIRDPWSGLAFADNRQSPVLGPGLAGVSVAANSYSSGGDTTRVSLYNSFGDESDDEPDFRERHTLQLQHQRNIGSSGLVLQLDALASLNRPGEEVEQLQLDGQQLEASFRLDYPIRRTRPFSIWIYGGFDWRDSEVDTTGGSFKLVDDKLRVLVAGLRGRQRDDLGYTEFELEARQGLDALGATPEDQRNKSRFDGKSAFTVVKALLEREIFIPGTEEKLSIHALAAGQYSSDPLLSAEEFGIGGPQFGRAYDPSEFTGDRGYGVAGEIRYRFVFDVRGEPVGLQVFAFGDHGRIENLEDGIPEEGDVTSFGGGVRLSLPYDINITAEVAQPVDELQRTMSTDTRFNFNFVKSF